jgi:HAD superfamily hydrolase (TIGR01548 family)
MQVDAVVLDVDGVLVDVADSYRRAIVESVATVYGAEFDRAVVQPFKEAGGFNNDWELTDALALYALAREAGYEADVETFAEDTEAAGRGLAGAQSVLESELDAETVAAVEADWDPERLRKVFQQLYLGSDRYREIEGEDPDRELEGSEVDREFEGSEADRELPGYINDEPILLESATIDWLREHFDVGVLTGRPAAEADIALERAGLEVSDDHRFTMDDWEAGKPDPDALLRLAETFEANALAFVGDTLDDVRTATNAANVDDSRTYHGIGVLTGGHSGDRGRQLFFEAGAEAVIQSVNDLPSVVEPRE